MPVNQSLIKIYQINTFLKFVYNMYWCYWRVWVSSFYIWSYWTEILWIDLFKYINYSIQCFENNRKYICSIFVYFHTCTSPESIRDLLSSIFQDHSQYSSQCRVCSCLGGFDPFKYNRLCHHHLPIWWGDFFSASSYGKTDLFFFYVP